MTAYHVQWEIEIDADTPEEAAFFARQWQQDQDNEALCFTVTELKSEKKYSVDLMEPSEDAVYPWRD